MSLSDQRIDPDTAPFEEIRALPWFMDAVFLAVNYPSATNPIPPMEGGGQRAASHG